MAIDEAPDIDDTLPKREASFVDLIKQDLAELVATVDVFVPVAGYEASNLAVKYRMPESGKELDSVARKVMKEFTKKPYEQNFFTAVDTMILLCIGLYVKPAGLDDYVMLDLDEVGEPVRFDHRLATMIGISETSTARTVVRKLFGNNDLMVLGHAERLNRWLSNTKADVEAEVWQLGEM